MAPLTPALRLLLGGVILRCSIAIAFFWGVHHVYIIRRGDFLVPYRRWFLIVSCIGVHTVDVFGVEVEHVGEIIDSGYEVGGGWALNLFIIHI